MNEWASNTGDTVVHYACGSGTFTIRKRLNAVVEVKSDWSGLRLFQIEIKRIREKYFLTLDRQKGKNTFIKDPLVVLCTLS